MEAPTLERKDLYDTIDVTDGYERIQPALRPFPGAAAADLSIHVLFGGSMDLGVPAGEVTGLNNRITTLFTNCSNFITRRRWTLTSTLPQARLH